MSEVDWHSTQNEEYLALQLNRLDAPPLFWCAQFYGLILDDFQKGGLSHARINDIGCNVGHFLRVLDSNSIDYEYRGYDISDTYLSVARSAFKEASRASFVKLDVASACPSHADYAVCSATFEHIEKYQEALVNILESTERMFVLRTFLGPEKYEICKKRGSRHGYLIRQINQLVLEECALDHGFSVQYMVDSATDSLPKIVCETRKIERVQTVVVFSRMVDKN